MRSRFNCLAFLFSALLVLLASPVLRAQEGGGDDFTFDDIPVDDVKQFYVAVGGGYFGSMMFMNFDELNKVSERQGLGKFEGQLTMHGGGGLVSLLIIPNLRMGVYGAAGSKVLEAQETDGSHRSLRFSASITGLQVDYAIRLFKSVTVLPGVMVGAENYSLDMTQSQPQGPHFDTLFSSSQGANHYASIRNTHPFYYPALNVEYAITQFFMVRAGVGYKGSFGLGDWTDDADIPVRSVPEIKSDGLGVQFGIFLGLFQNQ